MRWWDLTRMRLRTLFRRGRVERELQDEFEFHLENLAAENAARGMSPEESRFAALRSLGAAGSLKEECRDARRMRPVEDLARDARYAFRSLRKSPAFTLAAVLTLGLGIGASTAIFSVVDGVLLKPLPYREPDRIVALNTRFIKEGRQIPRVTGGDIVDLLRSGTFHSVGVYYGGEVGVQLRDRAEFAGVYWTTPGFPDVFGVAPVHGRLLTEADAEQAALVSAPFAQRVFGDAGGAVGEALSVEGRTYEIAGVLPAGFDFPGKADVWLAAPKAPENLDRTAYNYRAVARLKSGSALAGAQSELDAIASRLAAAFPASNRDKGFAAVPLREQLVGDTRLTLYVLMAAVSLVLLIGCANVANLLLARATARSREIALRVALGAGRGRIARQLMTESAVLACAAGALGVALAYAGAAALVRFAPGNLPRIHEVHLDAVTLLFACAVSLLASFLFGLAPAYQASRMQLKQARASNRLRAALVIAEIAISFVLATGAGLLFRSLMALNAAELGYRGDGLLVMYAHAPARSLENYISVTRFFENLMDEFAAMPGVKSAAAAMGLPAGRYGSNGTFTIEGSPRGYHAGFRLAGPGYFATMGVPLIAGRDFSRADRYGAPFAAVVSRTLARQVFPGEDPLGRRIQCGLDAPGKWMTIVGVVGDVRDTPASPPAPEIYMPLAQHPYYANEVQVALRTAVEPASLAGAVREKVRDRNPAVAMSFTTMPAMLAESVAAPRFRAFLIAVFAGTALLLALAGVYAVMAYAAARRTPEFGVRIALGAAPRELFATVLREAALLACAGSAAGLAVSLAAGRLIESMLFGLKPVDGTTYALTLAATAAMVLAGAAVPALRAARIDPVTALRQE